MVGSAIQKAYVEGRWFYGILSDNPKYRRMCNVMANVQKLNFAFNVISVKLSEVRIYIKVLKYFLEVTFH